MVTGAKRHFRRDRNELTRRVLLLNGRQRFWIGFGSKQKDIAHFERPRCGHGLVPFLIGHLADGTAPLLGDGIGFLLVLAEDLQAHRFAALEVFDDQIRVARKAFFPGIDPLGSGEF